MSKTFETLLNEVRAGISRDRYDELKREYEEYMLIARHEAAIKITEARELGGRLMMLSAIRNSIWCINA